MSEKMNAAEELTIAHNTEIAGYHFYTMAAALASDPKGRNVFTHLAKEELTHIMVIGQIAESVKSGRGWIDYDTALSSGGGKILAKGAPIFQGENELVERLKTNQTDINAVNIGIEVEENAVEFYLNLLKKAVTPTEKVVLTKILEMEKNHLKILRWESESLRNTGFWCGDMEYSVEKEAE
ncbi:MAG: ferritin family protein [Deltaproteobacteria bacterium]|nr:ferritin family protein [Deltaproteobacteria bacterium]